MRRLLPFGLVFAVSTSSLFAQKSEIEIRADIAFARGLAARGFSDLSEEVLGKVESAGLNDDLAEEVRLVRCEGLVAAANVDAVKREELLRRALSEYEAFVSRRRNAELTAKGEAGLIEVSTLLVRTLAARLEDASGEAATELKAEMNRVLDAAIGRTADLVDRAENDVREAQRAANQEPPDPTTGNRPEVPIAIKRPLFELLLNRGDLLLQKGKISRDAQETSFNESRKQYEKLSDYALEGSPWSLRGMIGIGENYLAASAFAATPEKARRDLDEAASFFEFAVSFSIPLDTAAWEAAKAGEGNVAMAKAEIQARFLFVQLGTPGLLRALVQNGKRSEAAQKWCMHYYNTWKGEDVEFDGSVGHLALLEVARTLVDAGGFVYPIKGASTSARMYAWAESAEAVPKDVPKPQVKSTLDFALAQAQFVGTENKGNNLQIRAQKLIGEILERPGVKVDPSILLDAAMGDYGAQEWANAIQALKRVVVSLDERDAATRQELMPRTLFHLGTSYQKLERYLEAAAVYESALEFWQGDIDHDSKNAEGFAKCVEILKRGIKGEAAIDALGSRADNYIKAVSSGTGREGDIYYRDAEKAYNDKRFEEARGLYAAVIEGAENYEKAMVGIAVCDYQLGRYEQTIAATKKYLQEFLVSAKAAISDPKRLQRRREATANATFYWGLAAYQLADTGKGDWQQVIDVLGDFHSKFTEQNQLAPAAMYRALIAYGRLNQQAQVRQMLAAMLQDFPDNRWTGTAAAESYGMLKEHYDAEKDEAKKKALLREMAENLQTLNRTSQKPQYRNMRPESRHWMDLGEWAIAEELLKRIQTQFGADPASADDLLKVVLPDLGEAILMQQRPEEAMAVLKPLVAEDAKFRATAKTTLLFVRAAFGYIEWDGSKVRQFAGAATDGKDLELAFKSINRLVENPTLEKWQAEWYALKAQQIFALYSGAKVDGKLLDNARTQMATMSSNLGPQFKSDGMPEELRQLYVWLGNNIK